jgi:hypothetical protein
MKILLISRGRTRSTYLQSKLCQTYNLSDYGERFNKNSYAYSSSLDLKYNNTLDKVSDLRWNHFCNLTTDIVNSFFQTENFAAKLWPRMLVSFPQEISSNIETYNPNIITNLSLYFRIKEYDQIYFLDRDITDSVCSWIYAKIIKNFLFKNTGNSKIDMKLQNTPVCISDKFLPIVNYYIYEIALQYKILEYLYENDINFIKLDYNDIPNYCNSTLQGVDIYKHSNFDYSTIITNYSEIRDHSINTYEIAKILVNKIKFT